MSNINKIKTYIEGLYDGEAPKHDQQCEFEDGYFTGIATISKFIDSLQEKKLSENLNEIAGEWAENEVYGKSDAEFEMAYKGFKAGAKWAMQQLKGE